MQVFSLMNLKWNVYASALAQEEDVLSPLHTILFTKHLYHLHVLLFAQMLTTPTHFSATRLCSPQPLVSLQGPPTEAALVVCFGIGTQIQPTSMQEVFWTAGYTPARMNQPFRSFFFF